MKGQQGILYVDNNEPTNIINALRPAVENLVVGPLNLSYDKADYYWVDIKNNERMRERKQLTEALSDIDAVDEQLQRHLHNCDELGLIVEGVGAPTIDGIQAYALTEDKRFYRPAWKHGKQPQLMSRWHSFKWSLRHGCGVLVEQTSHWSETVYSILADYNESMKPEHGTLSHYTHEHMPAWSRNLHIENLTRLKDLRIGEVAATKLIKEFGTFHAVINAGYADLVAIMGGTWTRNFLAKIGKG